MEHDRLADMAEKAISRVHSDQSVGLRDTLLSLENLKIFIEELISAIEDDIAREEKDK